MLIAVICTDKSGAIEIRKANRDAHLAYLKSTGVVVQAGPFLDKNDLMSGSLIILDVPNKATAEAWAKEDPYAKAELFQSVRIEVWNRVIG